MNQAADLERIVERCVSHITVNATHYFEVVKRSPVRGILWMVFTAYGNSTTEPIVKRVSFLPLETVNQTNAPSLLKMVQACVPETQFVAWFTVEGSDNAPLVSKVMIVEATPQPPTNDVTSNLPQSSIPASSTPQFALPPSVASPTAISGVRNASEHEAWRLRAEQGPQPTTPTPSTFAGGLGSQLPSQTPLTPGGASSIASGATLPPQEAYQKVLRISMAVADSAAQMGRTLDDITAKVSLLQKESSIHATMLQEVIRRLDVLEQHKSRSRAPIEVDLERSPPRLPRTPQNDVPPGVPINWEPTLVNTAHHVQQPQSNGPSNNAMQTPQYNYNSGIHSTTSQTSSSLTDMIRAMEEKLSRIKVPQSNGR